MPAPPATTRKIGEPEVDEAIYEVTVRLNVKAGGSAGLPVGIVQRLGANPDCRILRPLGDAKGGLEAWPQLRQPVSLREWLGAMEGLVQVSAIRGRDLGPDSADPPLTVRLKAAQVATGVQWLSRVNCKELLELGTGVCPRCDRTQR